MGDMIIVLFEIEWECTALRGVFLCFIVFTCIILIHKMLELGKLINLDTQQNNILPTLKIVKTFEKSINK